MYYTNTNFWTIARPIKVKMKGVESSTERRGMIRKYVTHIVNNMREEMVPLFWYVKIDFDYLDIIKFQNEDGDKSIYINANYYDFLRSQYTNSKWYLSQNINKEMVLVCKAEKKIYDGVVGIIGRLDLEDWGKE